MMDGFIVIVIPVMMMVPTQAILLNCSGCLFDRGSEDATTGGRQQIPQVLADAGSRVP